MRWFSEHRDKLIFLTTEIVARTYHQYAFVPLYWAMKKFRFPKNHPDESIFLLCCLVSFTNSMPFSCSSLCVCVFFSHSTTKPHTWWTCIVAAACTMHESCIWEKWSSNYYQMPKMHPLSNECRQNNENNRQLVFYMRTKLKLFNIFVLCVVCGGRFLSSSAAYFIDVYFNDDNFFWCFVTVFFLSSIFFFVPFSAVSYLVVSLCWYNLFALSHKHHVNINQCGERLLTEWIHLVVY